VRPRAGLDAVVHGYKAPWILNFRIRCEWSALSSNCFTPGKRVPDSHGIGCCVGSRVDPYVVVKTKILLLLGVKCQSHSP